LSESKRHEAGASPPASPPPIRAAVLIETATRWWAILGGALILILAVMAAVSAASNVILGRPLAADYELVKHLTAVAVFMFLPYCQITGSNITVDFFTEGMSERAKKAMSAFSSLFALAFAIVLFVQMSKGFQSYVRFQEVTPVLRLPLWTAFPPILVSIALLAAASCVTLVDGIRSMRALGARS